MYIRLDGEHHGTAIFRSLSRDAQSGLRLGHLGSHPIAISLLSWLWLLSCWVDEPSPQSKVQSALEQVIRQDPCEHCCIHLSHSPDQSHSHSMMLPSLQGWYWPDDEQCLVSSRYDACHSGQRSQSLFHQTRELFLMLWSFRCHVANSSRAVMSFLLRTGFRQAALPYRSDWLRAAEISTLELCQNENCDLLANFFKLPSMGKRDHCGHWDLIKTGMQNFEEKIEFK